MDERTKQAAEYIRKTLEESEAKRAIVASVEKNSLSKVELAKKAISALAINLKPVFAEKGKLLEVITPPKDGNLIEVLYYPKSSFKEARGVNTAALRIQFLPQDGFAKVMKRDSFFMPFEEVETVRLEDNDSVDQLADAAVDFAKTLAAK
jgi:hypothetical protein